MLLRQLARSATSVASIRPAFNVMKFSTPAPNATTETIEADTAWAAVQKSCYLHIDFRIPEDASVFKAVERMAGNYIGCLAVTEGSDPKGKVIGVVTERDYLKKVALLGKESKTTKVREICVYNPITVDQDEPIDDCMKKMLDSDIRHLLIRDKAGEILSVMSIKDCIKVSVARHDEFVRKIAGFAFGKTF